MKYFEYLHEESLEETESCASMLKTLNKKLSNEMLTDINIKILKKKKLFYQNFSQQFLEQLALEL